jgi:GT2 family glycosyltransferase
MKPPLVYVLVINWNGMAHLEACFDSLCRSSYSSLKLLLIDNASTDGSVEFVRDRYATDSRVEVLALNENRGWSGGNNAGMRVALEHGADFLFLMNNDTWTAGDAVERLVKMAAARPRAGMLAPKMVMFDAPHILNSVGLECSIIGASWDRGIGRHDSGAWDDPAQVIGVCGGAMFIRAEVVRQVGELPEEFEIYLDDLDLCLRAINQGYEIWTCPAAVVRHKFSASFGEGNRARYKYFLNTRNRFWLLLRHFPARKAPAFATAVLAGELRAVGRGLLDGAWWKLAVHARAWVAALAYLPLARRFRRGAAPGCRFWPLVLRRPHFCPRLELPQEGWYAERVCGGQRLRPMSAAAFLRVKPGRLRVLYGNCYPALGPIQVDAALDGEHLATFSTVTMQEDILEIAQAGCLRFASKRIFPAEATGEPIDIGGWFRVEPLP